jgi:hypothetical protein
MAVRVSLLLLAVLSLLIQVAVAREVQLRVLVVLAVVEVAAIIAMVLMALLTQEEGAAVDMTKVVLVVLVARAVQALSFFATPAQFNISLVAQ